jgi:hypothetical protein
VPIVLASIIVLVLVALFAAPTLASRLGPTAVAKPVVVAAVDAFDKHLTFDSQLGGAIKLDLSTSKISDKWHLSSLKCDDITVNATSVTGAVVATTKAVTGPDSLACVYSMKIPSGESLSVYAILGSPSSVGITGLHKLADGSYAKTPTISDPKTEGFIKLDTIKGTPQIIKLATAGSETLPLYIKLDQPDS